MIVYESYYGVAPLGSDEYVQHYGVIGMKWGQRRFQNKDGTLTSAGKAHERKTGEHGYVYKSHGTKKYTKKLARVQKKLETASGDRRQKLIRKAATFKKRRDRSATLDRREQAYAKRVKAIPNLALRAVYVGGKPYQQTLAMLGGQNQKGATLRKAAAYGMARFGGRLGSTALKAAYMRSDRVHNALESVAKRGEVKAAAAANKKKKKRK